MRRRHRRQITAPPLSAFAGFRFPPDVITLAVRWYLRYGLSYRDLEELLAERGITVDHVTVYRWVRRFSGWTMGVFVPGDRPVRSGHRWSGLRKTGSGGHPLLFHPRSRTRHAAY